MVNRHLQPVEFEEKLVLAGNQVKAFADKVVLQDVTHFFGPIGNYFSKDDKNENYPTSMDEHALPHRTRYTNSFCATLPHLQKSASVQDPLHIKRFAEKLFQFFAFYPDLLQITA